MSLELERSQDFDIDPLDIVEVVLEAEVEMVAEETDRKPEAVVDLSHAFLEIPIQKEDRLKRGTSKRIHAFVSTS